MFISRDGKLIEIKKPEEIVDDLKHILDYYENTTKYLRDKIANMESDSYKDDLVASLKKERDKAVKELRNGFYITDEEKEAIDKWKKNHDCTIKGPGGAIGGKYTYKFVPTSIGEFGTIECACGKEFSFRDDL